MNALAIDIEFDIPAEIKALIHQGESNLYDGPYGSSLSFSEITDQLGAWWDEWEFGCDLYYDYDSGEYTTSGVIAEEGFYECVFLSSREVKRMVFGRELAPYI